jgi:hypothetical protein
MATNYNRNTGRTYVFLAIGLVSCSMLMYEVLLTRICALRLFFHFGFLIISNCLLGVGASGSMIAVLQNVWVKRERFWIWLFSFLYLVSLILTYIFLLVFNIDAGVNFKSFEAVGRFAVFNLVAAIPFFFAGGVIGLILTYNADRVNKVYAIDLLGAGLGCLLTPFFLWQSGAGGCIIILVLMALAGSVVATPVKYKRLAFIVGGVIALGGVFLLPKLDQMFPVPSKPRIDVTKDLRLELNENLLYSRWSTNSRVDVGIFVPTKRFIFGRGKKRQNDPLPEQRFIQQDGSASTFIVNWSEYPETLDTLKRSTYGIATSLKKNPRVFVIGVGGGNDIWAAKVNGAQYIKGIELNQQVLDVHDGLLFHYSKGIIEDPRIELIHGEGRSSLMRETDQYDVIQMSGIDTLTLLTSGGYMMAEHYLYTVEAFQNMYDRLNEDGIISITRFAQEMETLRLLSNISEALKGRSKVKLADSVVCLKTLHLVTTLVKKGEFSTGELDKLARYAEEEGIEIFYHPGKTLGNVMEQFVRTEDKEQFVRDFPRNISPTTDDSPYFFNFTKWNILGSAPRRYFSEPDFVSQGNPLFIFGQLVVSTVLAVVLILLPVLVFRRSGLKRDYFVRFLVYFTGIGMGFIFIEIALMQKLVLFLGHPLYSITVTLFAILIFTGIGSLISERWFHSPTPRIWFVPVGLAVLLGLFILLSPEMVQSWIGWPLAARILVAVGILAPISILLGVPFAYGIRLLNRFNPTIIPWAWAVNACATVVGSILTIILSMNFGFNAVLIGAILIYFVTFFSVRTFLGEN